MSQTRKKEADPQSVGPKCMSIRTYSIDSHSRTMSVNTQPSILYNGMCSAHQTPALLYQPVWEYHCLLSLHRTLNHPQMLWHVFCYPPFCRMWGCAHAVAVYLQEEWAVEWEDYWLVGIVSRNAVSIQLCSFLIVGYHMVPFNQENLTHPPTHFTSLI